MLIPKKPTLPESVSATETVGVRIPAHPAAQALLRSAIEPAAAEPESRRKVRQALAPRATVANGVGVLEISGVLAYRPDLGEMFFDGFEDSAEVLAAFRRLDGSRCPARLGAPRHPYTALLLASRPGRGLRGGPDAARRRRIAGEPASPASPPPGCAFHPRCPRAGERCRTDTPGDTTEAGGGGRRFACHDPEPLAPGNFFTSSS